MNRKILKVLPTKVHPKIILKLTISVNMHKKGRDISDSAFEVKLAKQSLL
jgi:hypothetical protein